MSWALLAVGLGAALAAVPSVRPVRWWPLVAAGFVLGLLGAELAAGWLVVLVGAAAVLVALGGAAATPGLVGLALVAGAAAAMGWQVVLARRASALVQRALGPLDHAEPRPARWGLRRRLAPFGTTDPRVVRHADRRYAPGGGERHLLDVYTPRDGTARAPVLVQIHGGAWMTGNKATQGRQLMNRLSAAGWVCVAINYRLSPRVQHPEHLIDCKQALAWVREHIGDYGGDANQIVVSGGSAGGHLAALVALTANDPTFQPGFEDADTSVRACAPMYGAYALDDLFVVSGWGRRASAWIGRAVAGDVRDDPAVYHAASPIAAVRADRPPFLVCHGTGDNLVPVDQARRFVAALRAVGDPTTVVSLELPGAPHAFDLVRSVRTAAALDALERFFSWVVAGGARSPGAAGAATGPTTTARTAPS